MDFFWSERRRRKKRQQIEHIFENILRDIRPYIANPSGPLRSSILLFKNELLKEVQLESWRDPNPLETAQQFQETVNYVLSPDNFLSDKLVRIEKFREQAVIKRFAPTTNAAIGVAVGALVTVAVVVGVTAFMGPSLIVASAGLMLKTILSALAPMAITIPIAGLFGYASSKKPDYLRGQMAADALENFTRVHLRESRP